MGIAKSIGAKELRFADKETLLKTLAVAQGSVTPFALMNDRERQVHFVLDHCLFDRSDDYVNFHPLSNDATTSITIEVQTVPEGHRTRTRADQIRNQMK